MGQIFVRRTKWRQYPRKPRSVGEVTLSEKCSEAWRIACRLCGTGDLTGGQNSPEAEGTVSTTGQGDGRKSFIVWSIEWLAEWMLTPCFLLNT